MTGVQTCALPIFTLLLYAKHKAPCKRIHDGQLLLLLQLTHTFCSAIRSNYRGTGPNPSSV